MQDKKTPEKRTGGDRRYTFFATPLTRRKDQRRKVKPAMTQVPEGGTKACQSAGA